MSATAVGNERQTTLPADVCEAAGIHPSDQIEWRFEEGEIRGRKLEPSKPVVVVLGLDDVPEGSILPKGWIIHPEDIAAAIREEREEQ